MRVSARVAALALALAAIAPAAAMVWPPEIIPAGRLVVAVLAGAALILVAARWTVPGSGDCRASLLLLPPAIAAVIAAPGRARALDEAALLAALLAFGFLGATAGRDPRAGRLITTTLAALGAAAALVAIAQAAWIYPRTAEALRGAGTPFDTFIDAALVRLEAGRPTGPFILPAALAGFLAMALPATIAVIGREKSRLVRLAAAAAVALQAAALLLTRSIGGLVATACALAILLVPRAPRRILTVAAIVLAAGVVGALFLHDRRAEIGSGPGRDPLSLRAGNWIAAARMAGDAPLLGAGPGGFATAYTAYIRDGMNETRFAHNSWLQIPACWGLWTLVPLVAVAVAAARRFGAIPRAGREEAAIAAGAAAFLLHNLVDFTLYLPGVATAGAMVTGMALGGGSAPAGASPPVTAPAWAAGGPPGRSRWVFLTASLAIAAALTVHGFGSARAAGSLEEARVMAESGDTRGALETVRRACAARPEDPDPRALFAEIVLAHHMDDPSLREEGADAAAAAAALDRRSAVRHATLARFHAAAGDTAAAHLELARARALYPAKPQYHAAGERP